MKHKLLIVLAISFSFSLYGMGALKKKFRKTKEDEEITLVRVIDPTQPKQEEEFTRDTSDSDARNCMRQKKTLEDIQEELQLTEQALLNTSVEWFAPTKKRNVGNLNVIWKTVGTIMDEKDPVATQISTYESHYKNNVRWQWLSRLVFTKDKWNEDLDFIKVPIPVKEYLAWQAHCGVVLKLDALEEVPKIRQAIENAKPRVIRPILFASIALIAGIRLCMSNDAANKYIGAGAITAGLWQLYECMRGNG